MGLEYQYEEMIERREVIKPDLSSGLSFNPFETFGIDELNYMNAYVNVTRPKEYYFVNPKLALEQRKNEYNKILDSKYELDKKRREYINMLLKLNKCLYCYHNNRINKNTYKNMPANTDNINTNIENWNTGDKLLVYFDIMGFRSKMSELSHNKMLNLIENLQEDWGKALSPLKLGNHLKMIQFSDTIIIVTDGVDDQRFRLITLASIRIMQRALQNGFAIKGVMAQGFFSINEDKQIYFGKPLVDAFENYEDVHFYSVLVHHTAEATVKKYASKANPYYEGEVYLKSSKPQHCYLGWWKLDTKLAIKDNSTMARQWISELKMKASGRVRMYMKNTLELIERNDISLIQGNTINNKPKTTNRNTVGKGKTK